MILEAFANELKPGGFHCHRRLVVIGFRHARPLRTQLRDAGANQTR
jgi:hypothetical protein